MRDSLSSSNSYDLAGNLVRSVDGLGNITVTAYNAANQQTSVTVGSGTSATATSPEAGVRNLQTFDLRQQSDSDCTGKPTGNTAMWELGKPVNYRPSLCPSDDGFFEAIRSWARAKGTISGTLLKSPNAENELRPLFFSWIQVP